MLTLFYVIFLAQVFNKVEAKPYSSAADDPKEAITGARMDFFPNIRDWIGKFLDENGVRLKK